MTNRGMAPPSLESFRIKILGAVGFYFGDYSSPLTSCCSAKGSSCSGIRTVRSCLAPPPFVKKLPRSPLQLAVIAFHRCCRVYLSLLSFAPHCSSAAPAEQLPLPRAERIGRSGFLREPPRYILSPAASLRQ